MSFKLHAAGASYIIKNLYDNINVAEIFFDDNTFLRVNFIAKEIIIPDEDAFILKIGTIINTEEEKTIKKIVYQNYIESNDIYQVLLSKDTEITLSPGINIIEHEIKLTFEYY